jgi:hypothetical protein
VYSILSSGTNAIIVKLEDELDASEGAESLADTGGILSLEYDLKSLQNESDQTV